MRFLNFVRSKWGFFFSTNSTKKENYVKQGQEIDILKVVGMVL